MGKTQPSQYKDLASQLETALKSGTILLDEIKDVYLGNDLPFPLTVEAPNEFYQDMIIYVDEIRQWLNATLNILRRTGNQKLVMRFKDQIESFREYYHSQNIRGKTTTMQLIKVVEDFPGYLDCLKGIAVKLREKGKETELGSVLKIGDSDAVAKTTNVKRVYAIDYNDIQRTITLMDIVNGHKVMLAKLNDGSENHISFQYINKKRGKPIPKSELEKLNCDKNSIKRLYDIVRDCGFYYKPFKKDRKTKLSDLFFPKITKSELIFDGEISEDRASRLEPIDFDYIEKQIKIQKTRKVT